MRTQFFTIFLINDFLLSLSAFYFSIRALIILVVRALIIKPLARQGFLDNLSYRVKPHNVQQLEDNQKSYDNIVDSKGLEWNRDDARLVDKFWVVD